MTKNVLVPEGYKKTELGVIPDEWGIVQIDQLVNINRESRDPTKNSEESFYYIDIDAVENGTGLIKNPKRLFGKEAPSRARRVIHKDDVIMSTVRPYHKAFALVPQLYDTQICSTGFAVLSCGRNLDPKYLLQFLFSDKVIDQCTSMMAGGQYPALNTTQVSKIKITAPSLPEQQKIASILSKVDEQIEQTERIIEKTELLKKGLMQKLLTKGIGHTKFKKTEIGEIPEEWHFSRLIDQINIIDCKHITPKYQASGIPVIRPRNIKQSGIDFSDAEYISKEEYISLTDKHEPHKGDIVFSRNASFGVPSFVDFDARFCIGQDVVIMTENKSDTEYIYYILCSNLISKQLLKLSIGSTIHRVNLKDIRNLLIPIPPLPEQQKIASILSKVDSHIQDNQNYLTKLQELKKGLMQNLLTGKVRVCI